MTEREKFEKCLGSQPERQFRIGSKHDAYIGWEMHREQAALSAAPTPTIGISPIVVPTPPEVEPVGTVRRFMLETLHHRAEMTDVALNAKGKSLPDGTKLYTSPPSPKAEWDAEGNPLNLHAATEDYIGALDGGTQEALYYALEALRKFLGPDEETKA